MYKVYATPLIPPVSVNDLGAFLRLNVAAIIAEDEVLSRLLRSATEAAEKYLGLAVDAREFVYRDTYTPMAYQRNIRPLPVQLPVITLPYTNLLQINAVTVDGETLTADDYVLTDGDPATIRLNRQPRESVEIRYDAGYEYLPAAIEQGLIMHAAYLYEHRGACDVTSALNDSGAASFYGPYKVPTGLIL